MIEAIVLAAGASSRMGSPKALLLAPDGQTFLSRIVTTLADAGFARVYVVTGVHHAAIAEACATTPALSQLVECVRNPEPEHGQLSSLLAGMDRALADGVEGVLVTLVDIPMLRVSTVERVVERWQRTRAPIVRPTCEGRHGHPVIFDRALFAELRNAPLAIGAKAVVRANAARIEEVEVDDQWCASDVDTAADYDALRTCYPRA